MNTVYEAYTRKVVFEGEYEDCLKWILNQADEFNGARIYRTWTEDGDTYYDVGRVYILNF